MAFGPFSFHSPGRTPPGGVPVHMVVTVEADHGTEVPDIRPQDVTVRQGNERAQVTDFTNFGMTVRVSNCLFWSMTHSFRPA